MEDEAVPVEGDGHRDASVHSADENVKSFLNKAQKHRLHNPALKFKSWDLNLNERRKLTNVPELGKKRERGHYNSPITLGSSEMCSLTSKDTLQRLLF